MKCWSLPYDIRKKIRGNEIYAKQIKPNVNTNIYTKWIEDKANHNKGKRRTQSKRRGQRNTYHPLTIKVIIKNQNNNKVDLITRRRNQNKEALLTKQKWLKWLSDLNDQPTNKISMNLSY